MATDGIRNGRLARAVPLAGLAAWQGIGRVAGKLHELHENAQA